MNIDVDIQVYYKLETFNPTTGETRQLTDWFKNLLLTTGRNNLADQDWFTYVQIGTSDTAPSAAQDSLQGWYSGTNNLAESPFGDIVTGAAAIAPYYGWKRKTFEFLELTEPNVILKEVGIGWGEGDPIAEPGQPKLTTRGLIVDISGNTATPVWKTGEILRVTAEVRYYPPLGDTTGTETIDFNGTLYSYILRAANVTSAGDWADRIGNPLGVVNGSSSAWNAYPNDIEAITTEPTGVAVPCDNTSQYNLAYSNGTYQVVMGCDCGATGWNVAGGLRSIRFKTQAGAYQIQFGAGADPQAGAAVPKTTSFTMFFSPILLWSQGTIP